MCHYILIYPVKDGWHLKSTAQLLGTGTSAHWTQVRCTFTNCLNYYWARLIEVLVFIFVNVCPSVCLSKCLHFEKLCYYYSDANVLLFGNRSEARSVGNLWIAPRPIAMQIHLLYTCSSTGREEVIHLLIFLNN